MQVLRGWKAQRAAEDPTFDADDGNAQVFAKPDGSVMHPQLISDAFKRNVRTPGLPKIRLHDLGHTHATLLLKAGVPIKVVSERLGDSTPAFTMAIYQHVLPGMHAKPPRPSPACSSFYRIPPGRSAGRSRATRDEALART